MKELTLDSSKKKKSYADRFAVENVGEATRQLFKIGSIMQDIEFETQAMKDEMEESKRFHGERIEKLQKQIADREEGLHAFLRSTGRKSIATPGGRFGTRSRKAKTWADDDALVNFSEQHGIPLNSKQTNKPDKKAIEQFLADNPQLMVAPVLPTDPQPILKEEEVVTFYTQPEYGDTENTTEQKVITPPALPAFPMQPLMPNGQ